MKKVSAEYSKHFLSLRLYRDDVDQLLAIFERNGEKVDIRAGDYILSSLSDFDELKRVTPSASLSYLKLVTASHSCPKCPSPHEWLSLTLGKRSAHLYVSDVADTQLLGMAGQIEAYLRSRYSLVSYAASPWTANSVLWMYTIFNLASTLPHLTYLFSHLFSQGFHGLSFQPMSALDVFQSFLPFAIVMTYFAWATYTYSFRHNIVYLDERGALPGFIRRNKDQLIVNAIVGIICALVGAVVTVILSSPK